jgi:hypothetical protein
MYNNIYRGQKPQLQDFVSVLPSSNKIIKTGKDCIVTNCVHPSHEDKNPSMGIKQGKTQVIVSCFSSECNKQDLLSYFYERIPYYKNRGGKYGR